MEIVVADHTMLGKISFVIPMGGKCMIRRSDTKIVMRIYDSQNAQIKIAYCDTLELKNPEPV